MTTDFLRDVELNPNNNAILSRWSLLDLPDSWLVAGCLFQTVWNLKAGRIPQSGIKDYDLFYFDPSDLSKEGEVRAQVHAESVLEDLGVSIEVANQARVHLWYPEHFGHTYPQLLSVEDGVSRFLVLETCVGVRPKQCYSPFGLTGIYAGMLTPNPRTPYPELFASKVDSYRERWDWLTVSPAGVKNGAPNRVVETGLRDASSALASLIANETAIEAISQGGQLLVSVFRANGRVFSCGNGGSMCDAMHFAEELTGRYRLDRAALAATAISDPGHLTCAANDFGYDQVFSRYLEAHGRRGDCLVALSTSGTSKNVLRAAETARALGMGVISLTGRDSDALRQLSSVYICTPAGKFADRVQELHIKVLHIFIELIERSLFPQNYATDV